MAVDKLVDSAKLDNDLGDIADATRRMAVKLRFDAYAEREFTPAEMAEALDGMTGSIEWANGKYF